VIVVRKEELPMNDSTREFEGAAQGHGVGLSLVLSEAGPGEGPELHRHPYDEVQVVEKGRVLSSEMARGGSSARATSSSSRPVCPTASRTAAAAFCAASGST
jgi:hypothetical protein